MPIVVKADPQDSYEIQSGDETYVEVVSYVRVSDTSVIIHSQNNEDDISLIRTEGPALDMYASNASGITKIRIRPASATLEKGGVQKYIMFLSSDDDYANDAAAAAGGVEVGDLYHTSGAVKIRLV